MKTVMKLFTMTSFITVFLLLKNEHLSILKNKKNGGMTSTMILVSQMQLRRKSLVVKSQTNPFACSKSLLKSAAKKMHGFLLAITFPQLEPRCAKESWQKNYQYKNKEANVAMVLNMTELSIAQWSNAQLDAARKLCTDGVLHDGPLPTIFPTDASIKVRDMAWQMAEQIEKLKPEAIIIQGEPVFVATFVNNYCISQCYSPCYADGKFVQFRRF
nr:MAG TPA: hypothetical protein [Caudoviricetes sp.]